VPSVARAAHSSRPQDRPPTAFAPPHAERFAVPKVLEKFDVDDLEDRGGKPANLEGLRLGDVNHWQREVDLSVDQIGQVAPAESNPVDLVVREPKDFQPAACRTDSSKRRPVILLGRPGRSDPALSVLV